jgi:hypothetical protein
MALDPIRESTPVKDLRDVPKFLKEPLTLMEDSPDRPSRQNNPITPSGLPPLPPSTAKSLISHLPKASDLNAVFQSRQQDIIQNGNELLAAIRIVIIQIFDLYLTLSSFFSNSFCPTLVTSGH